jgi:hypothetical protein
LLDQGYHEVVDADLRACEKFPRPRGMSSCP